MWRRINYIILKSAWKYEWCPENWKLQFSGLSEHHSYFRHNCDMLLYVAVYKGLMQHNVIYENIYSSKFYITNSTKVWPLTHTLSSYDFIFIRCFSSSFNLRVWRGGGSNKSQSNITLTSLCTTYKIYTYKAPKIVSYFYKWAIPWTRIGEQRWRCRPYVARSL